MLYLFRPTSFLKKIFVGQSKTPVREKQLAESYLCSPIIKTVQKDTSLWQ